MTAGAQLARSTLDWLSTLDDAGRARASFGFDTAERFVWAFTPGEREGLALRDMTSVQREAAMAIVRASMSERGAREAAGVIALETVLGALEREQGRGNWPRRDPELYWFAVFGDPSGPDPWSWRVGGHHVAIHMTVAGDLVIGSSPSFLGANPAVVPSGPTAGARTLTGEEALARELLASLDGDARTVAVVDPVAPPEILTGNSARADAGSVPRGLRHADMLPAAQACLEQLIRHYLWRATDAVATADWDRAVADGLSDTTFAWAGSSEPGHGHYYAVHGSRLLIEYDNTQNGANHIHAVWRDLANDWGEDLLARHYRAVHGTTR
jgi:Protein of unknown function (DUF3500)